MSSPSCRRKEGRESYFDGGDPLEECPYNDHYKRIDWVEGWHEGLRAQERYEHTQKLLCMDLSYISTVRDLLEIMDKIGDER